MVDYLIHWIEFNYPLISLIFEKFIMMIINLITAYWRYLNSVYVGSHLNCSYFPEISSHSYHPFRRGFVILLVSFCGQLITHIDC